jgi:hypothetical protein
MTIRRYRAAGGGLGDELIADLAHSRSLDRLADDFAD